jgi:hypothetical protein
MISKLYYKLDENKNVVPATMEEANDILINRDKYIVKQDSINGNFISTVFLPINHNYNPLTNYNPPIIFETMIKNKITNSWLDYQERYATWKEAEEGHEKSVQWVKDGCQETDKL